MFVPHWGGGVLNFQVSILSLALTALVFVSFLGGLSWFFIAFSDRSKALASQSVQLGQYETNMASVRREVSQLLQSSSALERSLSSIVNHLASPQTSSADVGRGDLSTLFGTREFSRSIHEEINQIRQLRVTLDSTIQPLGEIEEILETQKELLADIPTLWPLKGVRGVVTQLFGPSIHPFEGYWYLHTGVDLFYGYGTPVVATARGKVTKVDYAENGFGTFIIIRHRYGFSTLYAHLQRSYVTMGETVEQGDLIGSMGNSGYSTGPHLHYEVHIGSQVVDPSKYLNMVGDTLTNLSPHLRNLVRKE